MNVIDVARRLADAHGDQRWSCPICAAEVNGENLAKHLDKKHDGQEVPTRWDARDRASAVPSSLAFVSLLGAAVVGSALQVTYARPVGMALTLLAMLALGIAAAAVMGAMPASLSLEGDRLELRYGFGLLSKRVSLCDGPVTVEVGTLKQRRASSIRVGENAPTTDMKIGSYLRVGAGGRKLTLASKKSVGLQHRLSSERLTVGPIRRHWDALVPPTALIALSLMLVERGGVRPRV